MTVNDLLDEAIAENELHSDYQLWHLIDAKAQELSRWRNGKTFPGPYHCARIAESTGRTFEQVTAIVQAEKEKNEERRKYWEKIASTAASIALLSPLVSFANNLVIWSKNAYILC